MQLNLRLPSDDVEAIRRLAGGEGKSVSVFVRDLVLGEPPGDDALSLVRSDLGVLRSRLEDQAARLVSLDAAVQTLEGSDPSEEIAALDRRLSRVEELAGL